ncbi:MAG: alkaline shock response membrane anchor protein AmaP [Candidatus Omnitrophota bacterium]
MRQLTLLASFVILICLSLACWLIVLGNSSLLLGISVWLPNIYMDAWGKIAFWAFALLSLGCSLSLLAMIFGFEPRMRKHIILEDESGAIGVSLDAIEDFIKRKAININGVRDLHVRAEAVEGELLLKTKVVLELQRNVPEFTKMFQEKIHRELVDTLGLQNVKEVQVLIQKILPRETKSEPILLSPPAQIYLKEPDEENSPGEDHPTKINNA